MLIILLFSLKISYSQSSSSSDSIFIFTEQSNNMISLITKGMITENTFLEYYGIRYSRFLINNLSAGVELGRSRFGEWERTNHIGLNCRYYYVVFKHFSFYAETQYLFGMRNHYNEVTASNWNGLTNNWDTNLGIAYTGFYKRRIGIELLGGYTFKTLYINSHPTMGEYRWHKSDINYALQISFSF